MLLGGWPGPRQQYAFERFKTLLYLAELDFDGTKAGTEVAIILADLGAELIHVAAEIIDAGVDRSDLFGDVDAHIVNARVHAGDLQRESCDHGKTGADDGENERTIVIHDPKVYHEAGRRSRQAVGQGWSSYGPGALTVIESHVGAVSADDEALDPDRGFR